jgi:hypothetical protein
MTEIKPNELWSVMRVGNRVLFTGRACNFASPNTLHSSFFFTHHHSVALS